MLSNKDSAKKLKKVFLFERFRKPVQPGGVEYIVLELALKLHSCVYSTILFKIQRMVF